MDSRQNEVVVTGLGAVTSIGLNKDELWSGLMGPRQNVVVRPLVVGLGETENLPIAAMPPNSDIPGIERYEDYFNEQECPAYRDLAYTLLAMEGALSDAGIEYDREHNNIGAVQATEAPGLEQTVSRLFELFQMPMPQDGPPPIYDLLAPYFYNSQAFIYVHLMGKALGLHGFVTSVHNACASGAFALDVAAGRIRSGQADVMLVAGGEAFDTAVRLEWFRRLDLYAKDKEMRPFDREPVGFFVGEGAGAVLLESAEHAKKRSAHIYAHYLGGGFSHQGFKQTVPDVRAGRLAGVIEQAVKRSKMSVEELDLVVPHGAGTTISDGYEAACLSEVFKGLSTSTVATALKPYLGHTLAASCIIETVCSLLALQHGVVPPTLYSRPEQTQLPVPLVTEPSKSNPETLLKLSTGFTGHDAALVFRKG